VFFTVAMRHVNAKHIHTRFDQLGKHIGGSDCWTDRGNDLRTSSRVVRLGLHHDGTFVDALERLIENGSEGDWPPLLYIGFPAAGKPQPGSSTRATYFPCSHHNHRWLI
jgi:hypothetical protein